MRLKDLFIRSRIDLGMECGESEHTNLQRMERPELNFKPEPPPPPDTADLHRQECRELAEQPFKPVRARRETHAFALLSFLPLPLSPHDRPTFENAHPSESKSDKVLSAIKILN